MASILPFFSDAEPGPYFMILSKTIGVVMDVTVALKMIAEQLKKAILPIFLA